jgi:hypothetical protein
VEIAAQHFCGAHPKHRLVAIGIYKRKQEKVQQAIGQHKGE